MPTYYKFCYSVIADFCKALSLINVKVITKIGSTTIVGAFMRGIAEQAGL